MHHRRAAMWLVLAALCLRILVPAGFMPVMSGGTMTVTVCSGVMERSVTVAIPGKAADRSEMPCGFAGFAPGLAAVDPVVLAIAIAFVLAAGFAARVRPVVVAQVQLWPPMRGPPAVG